MPCFIDLKLDVISNDAFKSAGLVIDLLNGVLGPLTPQPGSGDGRPKFC